MIARIDDSNITDEQIEQMNAKEFKNFENRLRSRAKRQGYRVNKRNHPYLGMVYFVSSIETNIAESGEQGINISELRKWVYPDA